MSPGSKIGSFIDYIMVRDREVTKQEELYLEEQRLRYLHNVIRSVTNYGSLIVLGAIIPIYFLSPAPQRYAQLITHTVLGIIMLGSRYVPSNWRFLPLSILIVELAGAAGYAMALGLSLKGHPDLSDVGFLSSLYIAMSIFTLMLCPYSGAIVLLSGFLHCVMGILAWSVNPLLKTADWSVIVVGSSAFAVVMFYSRLHRQRHEHLLEYRSRQLIFQNQQLRVAALEKDLLLAQKIQESFDPPREIKDERGFSVNFFQQKFDTLGGDWLASRVLPNGDLAILVADATGKGIQAALVIHAVQSLWAYALEEDKFDPVKWIQSLNKILCVMGQRSLHTMTLGLIVFTSTKLYYYSAGHVPLFIISDTKSPKPQIIPVLSGGSILGMSEKIILNPLEINLTELNPEAVLICTDGIFDRPTLVSRGKILEVYHNVKAKGLNALDDIQTKDDKMLAVISFSDEYRAKHRLNNMIPFNTNFKQRA